jgi:hypothetical protein
VAIKSRAMQRIGLVICSSGLKIKQKSYATGQLKPGGSHKDAPKITFIIFPPKHGGTNPAPISMKGLIN